MLNTIILLTNTVQQQQPLANLLREHNLNLSFCSALRARDLTAISPEVLRNARLVSFANDIAVSEKFLLRLGHGAYRFYTAPTQYPGLPPAPDESDDDPRCISVIAQSMTIWPDFRKVVGLETVTIPEGTDIAERDRLVFSRLAHLFWRMSGMIAVEAADLPGIIDAGESQRPSLAMMN
ncbi:MULTISPECIES: hypothetical protein [unclassified Bradyrhizobium]|uniref:hypothetical protein n=1 Tax=unclassified Bradyrhizobium TaxID=2631580 RepID=UPI0024799310|nr:MULTISPECIES: hypothetical protein [unclassified Bradyrhizobium]WGR70018.1 hypothetical protein MTX24_32190 [Bradyrhizobium sp. ISRA426]WGR82075.1 hypothetical protein MTX21_17295 [Bradyrhizobium sp. ISRA430]WGR85261.1 hypothetical protein MTX25_31865 [Bradyrhizobium sp. ISRA432]